MTNTTPNAPPGTPNMTPSAPNRGGSIAAGRAPQVENRASRSIDFLLDIPLEISVEIGRRSMTMGELIELTPGTVVELDHGADEFLDIMANGKLVARGEAVMVGDRYGVRVMEIVGDGPF
jgi:flagellar motor switch protein FliN/FliY